MSKLIKSFHVSMGDPAKVEEPILNFEQDEYQEELFGEQDTDLEEESGLSGAVKIKAEKIIERAHRDAKRISDEAMVKIDEEREIILEQAKKNGYDEGYDQAMQHCEDLIQDATQIKQRAIEEYEELITGAKEQVIELAVSIAREILEREMTTKEDDIITIAKKALECCVHKDYIVLKVSDEDFEIIEKSRSKLLAMVRGIGGLEVRVDTSLKRGSCLLETPFGYVDGGVDTRLEQVERAFKGLIER